MIVLFCGAIGISLAVEVGRRCERAQLLCRLGEQVRLLLDYSMTDTGAIFAQLASDPRFAPFAFLQGCDPAKAVTVATGLTARDDQELAAFFKGWAKAICKTSCGSPTATLPLPKAGQRNTLPGASDKNNCMWPLACPAG